MLIFFRLSSFRVKGSHLLFGCCKENRIYFTETLSLKVDFPFFQNLVGYSYLFRRCKSHFFGVDFTHFWGPKDEAVDFAIADPTLAITVLEQLPLVEAWNFMLVAQGSAENEGAPGLLLVEAVEFGCLVHVLILLKLFQVDRLREVVLLSSQLLAFIQIRVYI